MYKKSFLRSCWLAIFKLLIESYFDLTICVWLSLLSVNENSEDIWKGSGNIITSGLTIAYTIIVVVLPITIYFLIDSNYETMA
jgi:hypothetical protein